MADSNPFASFTQQGYQGAPRYTNKAALNTKKSTVNVGDFFGRMFSNARARKEAMSAPNSITSRPSYQSQLSANPFGSMFPNLFGGSTGGAQQPPTYMDPSISAASRERFMLDNRNIMGGSGGGAPRPGVTPGQPGQPGPLGQPTNQIGGVTGADMLKWFGYSPTYDANAPIDFSSISPDQAKYMASLPGFFDKVPQAATLSSFAGLTPGGQQGGSGQLPTADMGDGTFTMPGQPSGPEFGGGDTYDDMFSNWQKMLYGGAPDMEKQIADQRSMVQQRISELNKYKEQRSTDISNRYANLLAETQQNMADERNSLLSSLIRNGVPTDSSSYLDAVSRQTKREQEAITKVEQAKQAELNAVGSEFEGMATNALLQQMQNEAEMQQQAFQNLVSSFSTSANLVGTMGNLKLGERQEDRQAQQMMLNYFNDQATLDQNERKNQLNQLADFMTKGYIDPRNPLIVPLLDDMASMFGMDPKAIYAINQEAWNKTRKAAGTGGSSTAMQAELQAFLKSQPGATYNDALQYAVSQLGMSPDAASKYLNTSTNKPDAKVSAAAPSGFMQWWNSIWKK